MLAALDGTADEKLTSLALRIVLSDHIGIPQENQPDLLIETEQMFAPAKPKLPKAKSSTPGTAKPVVAVFVGEAGNKKASCLAVSAAVPDSSGAALFLRAQIAPGDTASVFPHPLPAASELRWMATPAGVQFPGCYETPARCALLLMKRSPPSLSDSLPTGWIVPHNG